MIHRSPYPDVSIPDVPLPDFVLRKAAQLAAKPAMIDAASGRSVTYGALLEAARRVAGGLVARGARKGEVLALIAPNSPEYAIAFHGTAMAGGVVTTVNPSYTDREIHAQLIDSGATRIVAVPALLEHVNRAVEGTSVREIYVIAGNGAGPDGVMPIGTLEGVPLAGPPLVRAVPIAPADLVVLPYSSGTTGVSKGVMLTHRNLVANVLQITAPGAFEESDVVMAVLPFFHIFGMEVMMNCGLALGATIVTMPRFELEPFLHAHQHYRVTRSFVVPPILVALAKHPLVAQFDLASVRRIVSGAAPLSAELGAEVEARLGCPVVQGYGMTELSPVSHLAPPTGYRPGSVGVTVPNAQTMIVDPSTGRALGVDEDGEIWVRGPMVMAGYLNNPAATASIVDRDGWLHTGDIGHVDAAGNLFVVDRLKELIKYKGFQVPPAELEALLLTHGAVADAAVVGLPDEEAGEVPAAFVVLKAGARVSAAEIMAHVGAQVAHYKQLRRVTFTDAIPKSASGKILRRVLRERAAG
jgi:4-coumarate--CoA ligase